MRTFGRDEVQWTPGRTLALAAHRRELSRRSGACGSASATFEVEPLMDDAELDSRSSTGTIYWEGPVRLRAPGGSAAGRGYLELTGYAGS